MSDEAGAVSAQRFDVWSMGPDEPVPSTGAYTWDDDLCEPTATTTKVGRNHFDGVVRGDHISCTGWIHLDGGSGWQGRVKLIGTLHLVNGTVGKGHLTVDPSTSPTPPFQTVHVDRLNPKRYFTE
jgi:hypothetical protein